ncbi:MAG: ABC transporter permease [Gemmataceae bacterium]
MRPTLTLIRREFTAFFLSPIAYVVLVALLVVMGGLFGIVDTGALTQLTARGPQGVEYPMQSLTGSWVFWFMFLVIPPLLTMRLLAEERGSGTLELLLTAPIRDWQVVLAKFIACYLFYVVLWIPTLVYLPVLVNFDWATRTTGIDPYPVLTSYIGLLAAGAMFLALGMFVSSLVKSQMVAALISILLSLIFVAAGFFRPEADSGELKYRLLYFFSVPLHFTRDFSRGQIDSRAIILYVSVALFCLFLTVRSLESRRWR